MKTALLISVLLWSGIAAAEPPYRLWWSMPNDDLSAIEVDDADLHVSEIESRWQLALQYAACDQRPAKRRRTEQRELRIDTLDGSGKPRATRRCVLVLADWQSRLGERLLSRLEDELGAHIAFLHPKKFPGQKQ